MYNSTMASLIDIWFVSNERRVQVPHLFSHSFTDVNIHILLNVIAASALIILFHKDSIFLTVLLGGSLNSI
jgi:hypothetical protein